jgi:hypothetical protein
MTRKRRAPLYEEDNVLNAIKDVQEGSSQRKAAQKWGIPQPVLSNRIHGVISKADTIQPAQKLTATEEDKIAKWILR